MSVRVNKASFSIREKLSELERPIGLKGSELMRAETAQEARDFVSAGRKNLIINGAMQVAQRGTSVSGITDSGYKTIDRQQMAFSPSGAVLTESRSTDAPDDFAYSRKVEVTTAGNGSTWLILDYRFEGQDLYSIRKGTSAAKPLTLSFWVKANHTADYVVELIDTDNDRIISLLYTINSANTWQKVEWNIPADTTGAFVLDNNESLQLSWFLSPGTIFTGGTRLTSWGARGSNSNRADGCNQFTNTVGNEFYLTGVQLEVGRNATEFEHRSYGEELALCQRYYQYIGGIALHTWSHGIADTGGMRIQQWTFPGGPMRTTPTATYYDAASGGNLNRFAVEDPARTATNTNIAMSLAQNNFMSSGGFKYPYGIANFSVGQSGIAYAYRMELSAEL